jgi:hypothetical protein
MDAVAGPLGHLVSRDAGIEPERYARVAQIVREVSALPIMVLKKLLGAQASPGSNLTPSAHRSRKALRRLENSRHNAPLSRPVPVPPRPVPAR